MRADVATARATSARVSPGASTRAPGLRAPRLATPAEPAQLLAELRDLALEAPLLARDEVARLLAKRLWRAWRAELAPFGATAVSFRDDVAAYRRELWLWAVGERAWAQALEGLAGREVRRAVSGVWEAGR
ncbi:MAG TPA: hypothetical protein VMD59_10055 [Acidimicrobiales bacterium]|nr:hypothetical protein [Acidimicrobiales bacterium]